MNDFKIYKVILLIFLLNILACSQKEKASNIEIVRFEKEFHHSSEESLLDLIKKYPFLFPNEYPISIWNNLLKDSSKIKIFNETLKVFQNFDPIAKEIELIFINAKNIFPNFTPPKVFTLNSESEYLNRVIYADSLLFISLDSYLGESYYKGIPSYISQTMNEKFITNDVAFKISEHYVKDAINELDSLDRTFLSKMIFHGKVLFINKLLLPENEDYLLFHSSKDKIDWANDNENNIWANFVENEYLYDTNDELKTRFILISPYSKFNLDIDKNSPGSIGKWLGYRIVSSFMKNNIVSIEQLMKENYQNIFNKSNYKPKKK